MVEVDAPSVNRALPPVGWQSTVVHDPQITTVSACEKTVVMAKHPVTNERSRSPSESQYRARRQRTWALDVHEVGVGALHKALELVLLFLVLGRGVEEVDGESLQNT